MACFTFSSSIISSDFPLELCTVEEAEPSCSFTYLESEKIADSKDIEWFREVFLSSDQAETVPWMRVGKTGDVYFLQFPGMMEFELRGSGSKITGYPIGNIPPETVRHLFVHQVMPLALSLSGEIVLHASAVVIEGKAAIFLGGTGSGKSTLASCLSQQGAALLTDDCLVLRKVAGGYIGFRGSPEMRLWEDSAAKQNYQDTDLRLSPHYTEKQRIHAPDKVKIFEGDFTPIQWAYALSSSGGEEELTDINIEPLSGLDACMSLAESMFRLNTESKELAVREFGYLPELTEQLNIFRLNYPHDFSKLKEVSAAVIKHCML